MLDKVIGQANTVSKLRVLLKVCKQEGKALPHILLEGGPGLGKSTLANSIANELNSGVVNINAATVKTVKDILPALAKISPHGVFFIDEIHRLPIRVQESLYTVMEDFKLDLATKTEVISLSFPLFTLIGATTKMGLLTKPFIDRFQLHEVLVDYSDDELKEILFKSLVEFKIKAEAAALDEVVARSKHTPRIAKKLLKWVVYYAKSNSLSFIPKQQAILALDVYGLDKNGLSLYDRKYLEVLKKYKVAVGIKTIASELNLSEETIQDYIEPYLLKSGMILKTKAGRLIA